MGYGAHGARQSRWRGTLGPRGWPGAFSHAGSLALRDLLIELATAAARRRGGSALGRRVHVSPSRLLGAAYRHTLPPHRKVCTPSERCPGHGGAWEVRRTDSSSSFSCACRRRGARTLSFCRIAPSKSFDSMAAAETCRRWPGCQLGAGTKRAYCNEFRKITTRGAGRIARKRTRNAFIVR